MSKLLSGALQLICPITLCAFFSVNLSGCTQLVHEAGFQKLAVMDPVAKKPMEAVYFYPSNVGGNTHSSFGPYHISAHNKVKIVAGRYPLLVISHGNAGSLWSHHDLAISLARHGNIVITLSHPRDNYKDQSGVGATSTVYGRPLQISAAITAALNHADLSQHIDASKIAFIGFSSGGETGLLLAGGRIDPSRYIAYCKNHQAEAICLAKGYIKNDCPALTPKSDPRIKAWVLMAPVSAPFSPESLKITTKPVLIFTGDKDEELSWHQNAGELANTLPSKPQLKLIQGAGHFVFLASCSSELRAAMPALCVDPAGIDRTAVHNMIGEDILLFLNKVWQGK